MVCICHKRTCCGRGCCCCPAAEVPGVLPTLTGLTRTRLVGLPGLHATHNPSTSLPRDRDSEGDLLLQTHS